MWIYKNRRICSHEGLHPDCTDFVYQINYTNGLRYIGKKTVRSIRRLKPTKAQLKIRKNYVRKEEKNLPFLNYAGSSKVCEGLDIESKIILYQCSDKKTATYIEAAILFTENALFDDQYLNENISGKFYNNDLKGLLEE